MPITRDRLRELVNTVPEDRLDEAGAALGLCARPDPASPVFADTVAELARRYSADSGRLTEALG